MPQNRTFTDDGYDLVMAVKQGPKPALLDRFQEYWMARCANPAYLDTCDVLKVLTMFAADNFAKYDWQDFSERLRNTFYIRGRIDAKTVSELILTVIYNFRMVYPDNI